MKKNDPLLWISILLHRYFKGEANNEEKNIVENWNPEDTKKRFPTNSSQVEEGSKRVKENIFFTLGLNVDKHADEKTAKRAGYTIIYRYAAVAVFFILVLGTGLYITSIGKGNKSYREYFHADIQPVYYETDYSEIKQVTLSDGSVIHLNGGTKLGIKESEFGKQKREVWLVDGEAFFDVAKDPDRPFIIYSKDLQVKVKGTSFNVKAYNGLKEQTVSVRSGKVEVSNEQQLLGMLTTNEQINYDSSVGRFSKNVCDYQNAMAWIDGRVVLENANAQELAIRLRQKFNVSLTGYADLLQERRVNAIFNSEATLEDIMSNVCALYNVKYKIKDKEVLIYR